MKNRVLLIVAASFALSCLVACGTAGKGSAKSAEKVDQGIEGMTVVGTEVVSEMEEVGFSYDLDKSEQKEIVLSDFIIESVEIWAGSDNCSLCQSEDGWSGHAEKEASGYLTSEFFDDSQKEIIKQKVWNNMENLVSSLGIVIENGSVVSIASDKIDENGALLINYDDYFTE